MGPPEFLRIHSGPLFLVVGVVIGLVVGGLAGAVLFSSSASPGNSPGGSTAVAVSVYSHAGAVSPNSTVVAPAAPVLAGSSVFVFAGYVTNAIGGGVVTSVRDTFGDVYSLLLTTSFAVNHSEALFFSGPVGRTGDLSVSVSFGFGDTPMGGSVAVVDVAGSGLAFIDGIYTESGVGPVAAVNMATNHTGDLFLLGVSGQMIDAPFGAGPGETRLDTAGAIVGPFTDGIGYGTFARATNSTNVLLSASLSSPAVWNAIGLGIHAIAPQLLLFAAAGFTGANGGVSGEAAPAAIARSLPE